MFVGFVLLFCSNQSLNILDLTSGQVGGEEVDSKILPYCSINKNEKRSIGEMEQEFLQAMQVTQKK